MEIWIIERILKNFERLSWEISFSLFENNTCDNVSSLFNLEILKEI